MSLFDTVTKLITWPLLTVGQPAPRLSLTADEGTWIKLEDFKDRASVVLVFFSSLRDDATEAWLKRWQTRRQDFEDLEAAIFGVNTARTDRLRELRNQLGLEYYLLYDPLAVDARGFHASGRLRPMCKPNVIVIDKQGRIAYAARGMADPEEALKVVARLEGKDLVKEAAAPAPVAGVRNPGAPAAVVQNIDSKKAESLIKQDRSPYLLVDVRTRSEYDADHSPYAKHIPVDEIPHRYQELGQVNQLIFVCQAGGRSQAAAEFLSSIGGTEIYNVVGGMSAWEGERLTGGR